jgi:hypothetical protein
MKGKIGEAENLAIQVYGDKFLEYDKVWYLVNWLNRHMFDTGYSYWLSESEE